MDLKSFLTEEQVIIVENTEKQLVIKELVQKLNDLNKINSTPRYYAQVIHRESLENTGIGKAIAIPHARTDSVPEYNCVFGVAPEGVEWQSFDGKPVKYILLSIFPTAKSTKYLYVVGMIARIFNQQDMLDKLEGLNSPEEIFNLLSGHAEKFFETISAPDQIEAELTESLANVPTSDLDLLIRLDRLYKLFLDDQENTVLKEKIDEIKPLLDNRSLTYYERMTKKCKDPFALVEKDACSGCNMNIPPIELNQIKEKNKISVCTHCGRFLIIL